MTAQNPVSVGKEMAKGTMWIYASSYGGKFIVFLTTLILARLLTQDDYGVVGYAQVFISFLDVLSDLGIGAAIIYYRKDPRAADTAFWLGVIIGASLYALSWLVAPLASWYFNDPRVIPVIRTLGLIFPIMALSNIHDNLLRKELAFKNKFVPDLVRSTSKGLFSITFALLGFGMWSLVLGQLLGAMISVVAYWKVYAWRPSLHFNTELARGLVTYGLNIVALGFLSAVLINIDYMFVGRYLGSVAMGTYSLAFRIPDLLISDFCGVIATVLFPLYVKVRDKTPEALNQAFVDTLHYVSIVTIPMGVGIFLVAEPFVLTFLTEKWRDSIPVIQAIAVFSLLYSFSFNTGSLYKAQNRVDIMIKLAILRLAMTIPLLYWAVQTYKTPASAGWAQVVVMAVNSAISIYVTMRMMHTPFSSIWNAVRPGLLAGLGMGLVVEGIMLMSVTWIPLLQLLAASLMGVGVYTVLLYWQEQTLVLSIGRSLVAVVVRR
jgi:O-antigen/teichoic acid export membrane protein